MNLLIVEDEQNSREGILHCIDWARFGLSVKAAKNGLEAMDMLDAFRPDIVITDIKMPKMNGIELAKVLKERFKDVRIIFLSGYDDKEYLMNAIRIKIDNYLLKPVSIDELEDIISGIVDELKEEQSSQMIAIEALRKQRFGVTLLRDDFSRNLIDGRLNNVNVINTWIHKLELPLSVNDNCFAVVLIRVDSVDNNMDAACYDDQKLIDFSIRNIVDEIISVLAKGYVFRYTDDQYLCIVKFENENDYYGKIGELSLKIKNNLSEYISVITTVSAGNCVMGIDKLKKSYRQADRNIQKGKLYIEERKEKDFEWKFPQDLYQSLEQAIRNGNNKESEKIIGKIEEIYRECDESDTNAEYMLSFSVYTVMTVVQQLDLKEDTTLKIQVLYENFVDSSVAVRSFQIIREMIDNICDDVNFNDGRSEKDIVKKIKEQLESHYYEDISISKIARSVFLSSTYICILFKKQTGMTINEYLSNIRIERAKALLINSNHTVAEVALSVGYHDPKYFSRIFRKIVGVPPSEYYHG